MTADPQQKPSSEPVNVCHYCGPTDRELRPYGPGGSTVCFPCMKATPKREKAAQGAFGALLDGNAVLGGGIVTIGTSEGPTPGPPTAGNAQQPLRGALAPRRASDSTEALED